MLVLVLLASPHCCIGRDRLLLVLLLLVASMPVLMHMCMKSQSERSSQSKRSKYLLVCQVSHAECACAGEELLQRNHDLFLIQPDPAVALSNKATAHAACFLCLCLFRLPFSLPCHVSHAQAHAQTSV